MRVGGLVRVAALALLCCLVFLPGITSLPLTDRDEARFVQSSRQMVESGDFLDIRFQDVPRYKKPIGIYWLHSAAAELTGHRENPPLWSFRLVSFAGALVAAFATMWIAGAMFGPTAGFVAGALIAAAFGLGFEARIAKTDAFLLGVTVLAQGALAQVYLASREKRAVSSTVLWLFWAAQGVGILIKGPVTPLLSLLTILTLIASEQERGWVRALKPRRGILMAIVIVLPWLVAITWKSGGAFWQEAIGHDLLGKVAEGQESHGFPPGYYSMTYSVFLWPLGYLGLLAGLNAFNRARLDPRLKFLLAWYLPLWLVLELVPTKLPHYMLPAYPAAAIAIAWFLTDPSSRAIALAPWQRWLCALGLVGLAAVTLALAVLPLGLVAYLGGSAWIAAGFACVAALGAGALAAPPGRPVPATLRASAICLCAGVFMGATFGFVLPSIQAIWPSRAIAQAYLAGRPCARSSLAAAGYSEPSLVFLAGTDTRFTDAEGAAASLAGDPQCAVAVVTSQKQADFLARLRKSGLPAHSFARVTGIDYSNGHHVDATLFTTGRAAGGR